MEAEPDKLFDWVTPGCIFIVDELWKILSQGGMPAAAVAQIQNLTRMPSW
jgi:hypothetical protein